MSMASVERHAGEETQGKGKEDGGRVKQITGEELLNNAEPRAIYISITSTPGLLTLYK
jgi:hypothetical protein